MGHLGHQVKTFIWRGFPWLKASVRPRIGLGPFPEPALSDGRASEPYAIDRAGAKPYSSHSKTNHARMPTMRKML